MAPGKNSIWVGVTLRFIFSFLFSCLFSHLFTLISPPSQNNLGHHILNCVKYVAFQQSTPPYQAGSDIEIPFCASMNKILKCKQTLNPVPQLGLCLQCIGRDSWCIYRLITIWFEGRQAACWVNQVNALSIYEKGEKMSIYIGVYCTVKSIKVNLVVNVSFIDLYRVVSMWKWNVKSTLKFWLCSVLHWPWTQIWYYWKIQKKVTNQLERSCLMLAEASAHETTKRACSSPDCCNSKKGCS